MQKQKVTNGVYWVEIPEADLFILCGCPADSVKHLMKAGLIVEREKNGVVSQTGPNAILLSDTTIQKGSFSNLAEFPVLQMLYLQGMILPNHPNNTGRKPMLIGLPDQVASQSSYIYRGTYGLSSFEEIAAAGVPEDQARDMLRIKRWFAFDNIRRTEDLLDLRVVDTPAVELRQGAFVRRTGFNRYEFIHGGSSVTVDLNLVESEEYPSTYQLGFHKVDRAYFSVVHIGEGDGWDVTRPCMGSIVCFQGRIYLVDAGPGIQHTLTSLGISINEVAGIFHTHGHDDHFAGLTSLVRADHRIPYFATTPVRASVVKKYAALTGRNEATFYQYFEPHDLAFDRWNAVDGLEIMPVFSPHPVETSVFFFRTFWEKGYRSYAHLADLSSFEVLKRMVTEDVSRNGISQEFYDSVRQKFLTPADVKKIDIGGGLIHGRAEDFSHDTSKKLFLSHTSLPLTDAQKQIGSRAEFGQENILIPSCCDYLLQSGERYVRAYFPDARPADVAMLGNCPTVTFPPDSIILHVDAPLEDVYLVLSGRVELLDAGAGIHSIKGAGALIGEVDAFGGETSRHTCRALSTVMAMRISREMYLEFIRRVGMEEDLKQVHENRQFLQSTWLFGDMLSFPLQVKIARAMERRTLKEDDPVMTLARAEIILLADGLVTVFLGALPIENLTPGDFFGEENLMRGARDLPKGLAERFSRAAKEGFAEDFHLFEAKALLTSTLFAVPADVIEDIPIVQWKLMETYERRLKTHHAAERFAWDDSYGVGIPDIDEQHRTIFEMIDTLAAVAEGRETDRDMSATVDRLVGIARTHLQYEEALADRQSSPEYGEAIHDHGEFFKKAEGLARYLEQAPVDALHTLVAFLQDWIIDHSLLENRRFKKLLQS